MEWKKELKDYIANNMSNKVSYKMPESLKKIIQEKSNGVSKKN